jgi:glycosyltransferase involved in cell wall biosynthesis
MSAPQVSILMPVYNAAQHLGSAIESVVAQDFTDWEMVTVDDGSTDSSPGILARWTKRDPRIRVIANASNKGQTACLNQGLAECRAAWIARHDADDLSHPGRLASQWYYLGDHPDTVLLGTQGVLIDDRGVRIGLLDVPEDAASIAWSAPFLNPFLHTAVMFRRDIVTAAGGYDESFRIAQDYELWTRLAADHSTANLSRRLVSYRHAETSLSKTGRNLAFEEADRVSAREARRLLGRVWSEEEQTLISSFRRGLDPGLRAEFVRTIDSIGGEISRPIPRRLRAAWHLRLAGTEGASALSEIRYAMHADITFTLRWLRDRFFSS